MVNTIETIIYSASFAYIFAKVTGIPQGIAKWLFRHGVYITETIKYNGITTGMSNKRPVSLKPFSCEVCLSFWTALAISLTSGNNIIHSIGIASASSLLTTLISAIHAHLNR